MTLVCACGRHVDHGVPYPPVGVMLLSMADGSVKSMAAVGRDLVAVAVSDDGHTAFLADNDPGDVYAVELPTLKLRWKTHTGGAPFGLLVRSGRLQVTLYDEAQVDDLDPVTGRVIATFPAIDHPAAMTLDAAGELFVAGSGQYGTATVGGDVWTGDYKSHELFDVTHPRRVPLPFSLAPFWLSAGAGGSLLVTAEGADEDADAGGVFSYDTMSGTFKTLATPRDPDQVILSGSTVLVAAHGERSVLAIGERTTAWATGAAAVALAPDPELGLLVVAANGHE